MPGTRGTQQMLCLPRSGAVWPSLARAAISGASGGIGSRQSNTEHQTANRSADPITKKQSAHDIEEPIGARLGTRNGPSKNTSKGQLRNIPYSRPKVYGDGDRPTPLPPLPLPSALPHRPTTRRAR